MRMTAKGQVTIPVDVRRWLNLGPGDEIKFETRGGDVVVLKSDASASADELAEFATKLDAFRGVAEGGLFKTTDEWMDFLRGNDRRGG